MRPANITPPELVRIEAFANTLDLHAHRPDQGPPPRDRLDSPAALRAWLVEHDLAGGGEHVTEADLALAREVRGALRAMLRAPQVPLDQSVRQAADRALTKLPLTARLGSDGPPTLGPARGGVRGALAELVVEAVVAGARGWLARLKICSAEDCQWVYYDAAQNRMGRWCSMDTCGNRAKTRRYRQRRRTAERSG